MSANATPSTRARVRGGRQRGQSSTEYVVVCAALAAALGIGMADESSVLRQLLAAFFAAFANFSYAISIPG